MRSWVKGSGHGREVDWNGVALWRLARAHLGAPAAISEYLIAPDADMAAWVEQMREDLEIYAAGFLRGDLNSSGRCALNSTRSASRTRSINLWEMAPTGPRWIQQAPI